MAAVADALGVNAGRQGQLVGRAGFAEDATTVLADVLEQRRRTGKLRRRSRHKQHEDTYVFPLIIIPSTKCSTGLEKDAPKLHSCPLRRPEVGSCAQEQFIAKLLRSNGSR